ncbi:MAG: hypothetical protein IPK55_11325 [Streptococcus sp.]|jgi:hypothetical protein|nr:hypothetical protein [Streptococcus sp.]
MEELKESEATNKVYKETIRRYLNIFLPSYFKAKAVTSSENARSTLEDERAKFI